MLTTADYLSAIVLTIIGIAVFINLKNGTLPEWAAAKFLGEASSSGTSSSTSSSATSASSSSSGQGFFGTSWNPGGAATDLKNWLHDVGA